MLGAARAVLVASIARGWWLYESAVVVVCEKTLIESENEAVFNRRRIKLMAGLITAGVCRP